MKCIIMADGTASRWDGDSSKQLAVVEGETLLSRTVRLLRQKGISDITITSRNPNHHTAGAKLHKPQNNKREIDRFTEELIEDNICFLYGDTFYSESCISRVVSEPCESIRFFGNQRSIVAVRIVQSLIFLKALNKVKQDIVDSKIEDGKGWHVYRAHNALPYNSSKLLNDFIYINDVTCDINTIDDYDALTKSVALEVN